MAKTLEEQLEGYRFSQDKPFLWRSYSGSVASVSIRLKC